MLLFVVELSEELGIDMHVGKNLLQHFRSSNVKSFFSDLKTNTETSQTKYTPDFR